jgi:hypothetical protein
MVEVQKATGIFKGESSFTKTARELYRSSPNLQTLYNELTKKHSDYDWFVKQYTGESFGDATCAKTAENVLKFSIMFFIETTIYARAKSSTPKIIPSD